MTAIPFTYRSLSRTPLPAPEGRDKNERGRVLAVAGSEKVPGAALLSGEACLRAGAGKVQIAIAKAVWPAIGVALPECGFVPIEEDAGGRNSPLIQAAENADCVLIGPGLTDPAMTARLAGELLRSQTQACCVIDALALESLAENDNAPAHRRAVITPHRGELASMMDVGRAAIDADPLGCALRVAQARRCAVILKDAVTYIVTPDGQAWVHEEGVPGLATSGSGDVLAGILTGLLASGVDLPLAAQWAVAVHAEVGRRLSSQVASVGFLAREIPALVPGLLRPAGPE